MSISSNLFDMGYFDIFARTKILIWTFCLAVSPAFAELKYSLIEVQGQKVGLIKGDFDIGEKLSRFKNFVRNNTPHILVLQSPGGSTLAGMKFGRYIREQDLKVWQPQGFRCYSACSLAFMGGTDRKAMPGTIGVHRTRIEFDRRIKNEFVVSHMQDFTADLIDYHIEMGIDLRLLGVTYRVHHSDIKELDLEQLQDFDIVTGAKDGEIDDDFVRFAAELGRKTGYVGRVVPQSGFANRVGGKQVTMHQSANGSSAVLHRFEPGDRMGIFDQRSGWYEVIANGKKGYVKAQWIKVDQFVGPHDGRVFIQVATVSNADAAVKFVEKSKQKLHAIQTVNDRFVVVMAETYPAQDASEALKKLKQKGAIPKDSFVRAGNQYLSCILCDWPENLN